MYQAKNKKNAVIISEADSVADKESKQEILIVDDSEMNRAILAEMLGDSYIIHEAVNGEEALHLLERQGTSISPGAAGYHYACDGRL